MDSVLIFCDRDSESTFLSRIPQDVQVHAVDASRRVLERHSQRAYLDRYDQLDDELEPEEVSRIRVRVSDPVYYTLSSGDIAFCKDLLAAMADDPNLMVNDDHGFMTTGREFVARIRDRPDWDWRRD